MDSDVVTVRDLRKDYGGRTVVDGLDLDVREGEVMGLIGTNGAGKTTTVECIQGLREPDGGTVRVFGLHPVRDAARVRALVGSQLQDAALPDRLRVGEAVRLFGGADAARGGTGAGGAELVERFGLARKLRSPFAGLSGGERQRLFLVLALLGRPRLVVLDELTQGLDPSARREVWNAVRGLRVEGTTVLLVTHELDEAEALCDRVVALRDGRVLDRGRPAELIARHAPWATVRFGRAGAPAGLTAELAALPGVVGVDVDQADVRVTGDRGAVAQVGAELVRHRFLPDDLRVETPGLEAALLRLLEGRAAEVAA